MHTIFHVGKFTDYDPPFCTGYDKRGTLQYFKSEAKFVDLVSAVKFNNDKDRIVVEENGTLRHLNDDELAVECSYAWDTPAEFKWEVNEYKNSLAA